MTNFLRSVPILPARDVKRTVEFYEAELGFERIHAAADYGIVRRWPVELHPCGPSGIVPDESDTMLRIEVLDIGAACVDCDRRALVHPNVPLHDEPWGTREFSIRDLDGNLVTFFSHRSG